MKKRYEIVFDSKDDISIQTKQEFIYDKVLKAIKKYKKGLTNTEVSQKTGIVNRRIREATQRLKIDKKIKVTYCRCGHTPIYHAI